MTMAELREIVKRLEAIRDLWAADPQDVTIGHELQRLRNWVLMEFGPF